MKRIIFILSLMYFNQVSAGFFDMFFKPPNTPSSNNTSSPGPAPYNPGNTPFNIPTNIPSCAGTTSTNPQASSIKQNININDNMTLEAIKEVLYKILEEIKKGHFNIFNVNLQNGNAISSVINNENLNNLNNKNNIFMSQRFTNIKNQGKEKFTLLLDWLKNNKKKTCFTAITLLYAALNTKLASLTLKLSNQNNWSNWQPEKTLEELYRIPQNIFSIDLLKAIQNFYMQLNNITDYVTPISKFIFDIHKEINNINTYTKIINILKKLKINYLFVYSNKIYLQAPDRLNRLLFIKNIFLSWLAEHKLNQFRKIKKLTQSVI